MNEKNYKTKKVFLTAGVLLLLGAIAAFLSSRSSASRTRAVSSEKTSRQSAYTEAMKKGQSEIKDWPATPEALIQDFWAAASRKDYQRLVLLCPGSTISDYKQWYDKWSPSLVRDIAAPEAHPTKPGVILYPVKVDFTGFPNKTIKMSIIKARDGRFMINGRNTIWW